MTYIQGGILKTKNTPNVSGLTCASVWFPVLLLWCSERCRWKQAAPFSLSGPENALLDKENVKKKKKISRETRTSQTTTVFIKMQYVDKTS